MSLDQLHGFELNWWGTRCTDLAFVQVRSLIGRVHTLRRSGQRRVFRKGVSSAFVSMRCHGARGMTPNLPSQPRLYLW